MTWNDERRRAYNREWHRLPPADGRCEARTNDGRRCVRRGWYDGFHGAVLCNQHANRLVTPLASGETP